MIKARSNSKLLDGSSVRDALRDNRVWTGIGVVQPNDGQGSHFQILTDTDGNPIDVLVDIILAPWGDQLTCRLASFGGCNSGGIWRIPEIGTEVAVMIPTGQYEADPIIIGTLSSNSVPSQLDATTLVLINPGKVHIEAASGDVELNAAGHVNVGGSSQPIPLGTALEERIAAFELVFNKHTHISATAGDPTTVPNGTDDPGTQATGLPTFQSSKGQVS